MALDAQEYPGHTQCEEESEKLLFEKGEIQKKVKFAGPRRRYQSESEDNDSLDRLREAGQGSELGRGVEIVAHVPKGSVS